jgi:hypothetical protein
MEQQTALFEDVDRNSLFCFATLCEHSGTPEIDDIIQQLGSNDKFASLLRYAEVQLFLCAHTLASTKRQATWDETMSRLSTMYSILPEPCFAKLRDAVEATEPTSRNAEKLVSIVRRVAVRVRRAVLEATAQFTRRGLSIELAFSETFPFC